jgi:cellulose synthase/poly-beta-1,6-N-acetylglucosamine synthase-like glycosyltransferase
MTWLLCTLAVLCACVAQHPYFPYPLSLVIWKRVRPKPLRPADDDAWPVLSVLCCCYNEAGVLEEKLQNGFNAAAEYPGKVQFLYFSDGSSDRTADILQSHADAITPVIATNRSGKSVGIRELSQRASGDILVFTDANTFIAKDALVELAKAFRDPEVGGAAGRLEYTNPGASDTTLVNSAYWRIEESIKTLESDTGNTMGADGAFFAIRKHLHAACPPDIIDDMHTSLNIVLSKQRFVSLPSVRTYEKTPTSSLDEFRRKIRIACRAFNCYRLLAPRIHRSGPEIIYKFYSHKVLRWFGLCFLLAGLVFASIALALTSYAFTVVIGLCVAALLVALGALGVRPFGRLKEIFVSLVAVTLGVIESLRGKRYQTWKIAASGR